MVDPKDYAGLIDTPEPKPAPLGDPSPAPDQPATAPAPAAPGKDLSGYDALFDQDASARQVALRSSLMASTSMSPEQHAKILDLSQKTGLAPAVINGNEPQVQQVANVQQLNGIDGADLQKNHPDLFNWLTKPNNAGIARNDVDVLTTLSHITQQIANPNADTLGVLPPGFLFSHGEIIEPLGQTTRQYSTMDEFSARMQELADQEKGNKAIYDRLSNAGMGSVGAGLFSEGERVASLLRTMSGQPELPGKGFADYMTQFSQEDSPGVWGDVKRAIGGQIATLPLLLAGGPIGKAAGSLAMAARTEALFSPLIGARAAAYLGKEALPVAATMAPMAAVSGAETANERGPLAGALDAMLNTAVPGLFGKVGVAKHLLADTTIGAVPAGYRGALKDLLTSAFPQAGIGATQVLAGSVSDYLQGDKTAFDNLGQKLAAGGITGGLTGAAFALPDAVSRPFLAQRKQSVQALHDGDLLQMGIDAYRNSQAAAAGEGGKVAVQQLIDQMAARGRTSVWMQHEDFANHAAAQETTPHDLAAQLGINPDEYDKAKALDMKIKVPMGAFFQMGAEEKTLEPKSGMASKVAMEPDGLSAAEAAKAVQDDPAKLKELQDEVKKLAMSEMAAGKGDIDAPGSIKERIAQAHLDSGQYTAQQANHIGEIYQRFFNIAAGDFNEVRAKAGANPITAEDLLQGARLHVASKLPEVIDNAVSSGKFDAIVDKLRTGGADAKTQSALASLGIDLSKHSNAEALALVKKRLEGHAIALRQQQGDDHGMGTESGKHPHGGDKAEADKEVHDSEAVTKRLGKAKIDEFLRWTMEREPHVPVIEAKNVPYGMGMDVEGNRIAKDPQFKPEHVSESGKSIDTIKTTKMHEIIETRLMGEGMHYEEAHAIANAVEAAYLRHLGFTEADVKHYEENIHPMLRRTREWTGEPPEWLNTKPYEEEGEMHLLRPPGSGKGITFDQGERINAPSSGRLDLKPLQREWAKANGGQRPDPTDQAWHKLVVDSLKKDAARGVTYGQDEGIKGTYHSEDGGLSHIITLWSGADVSTAVHEPMHYFVEVMGKWVDQPDCPERIKKDYQTLLEFSGYQTRALMRSAADEMMNIHRGAEGRDLTPDEQSRLKELAAPHEKLAKAWERYFMEGVAPAPQLRAMFAMFKGWMLNIYKSIKNLGAEINPEIRAVFDRMLASDREIRAAKERVDDTPAYTDRNKAGMSEEEWTTYQNLQRALGQAQRDRLESKLHDLSVKAESDAAKADRAKARDTIADQVGQEKPYAAMSALQHGETPDGRELPRIKLKRSEVAKLLTEDEMTALPGKHDGAVKNRGPSIFSDEDTTDPETAAKLLNYGSAGEMLKDLAGADDRDSKIDSLTDAAMKSKYPVPSEDPELMARLADTALHEPAIRARLLEMETQAAARLAGVEKPDFKSERKQMAIAAREIMRGESLSSIKPERHIAAERRAANAFAEALHEGDYQKAWLQKRKQLMNAELTKAAYAAQERGEADRDRLQNVATSASLRKSIGKAGGYEWTVTYPDGRPPKVFSSPKDGGATAQEQARREALNTNGTFDRTAPYLDQIDGILSRYSLKTLSPAKLQQLASLRDFLYGEMFTKDGKPTGVATDMPKSVLDQVSTTNWKSLTSDEFHDVRQAVDALAKMARLKNTVDSEGSAIELQAKANEIATSLEAHAITRWLGDRGILGKLAHHLSELVSPPRLAEQADGHVMGPMQRNFVHPAGEAFAREIQLAERLNAPKREANAEWGKRNQLDLVLQKPLPEGLQWGRIGADNKLVNPKSTMSLGEKLKLLATYGHKEGRQRVQDMHQLNHEDVIKILSTLDAKDIEYSNKLVDIRESLWSDVKAQDEKYNGSARDKVEALPVELPNGTYKGGYDHLYYDGMPEQSPEEITQGILSGSATRGMTVAGGKERVAELKGKAVSLNLADWDRAQYEVVHQLSHRDFLVNNFKLLTNPTVKDAMERALGRAGYDVFLRQAQGMAVGNRRSVSMIAKWVNTITSNANFAAWGFNPVFAAAHASQSVKIAGEVGGLHAISSALAYGRDVKGITRQMYDLLPELEAQSKSTEHITNNIPLYTDAKSKNEQAGMWMVHKMFWQSQSVIAAHAAYTKHMAETSDTKESAAYAMQVVNRIAGSNADKDIPELKRNPAFKALLNRMTFDIANYNSVAGAAHQVQYGLARGEYGHAINGAVRILASTVGQGLVWSFIYDTMKHQSIADQLKTWDTPGHVAENLAMAAGGSFVRSIPLIRDLMAPLFDGHQPASVTGMGWMTSVQGAVNYAANTKHKNLDKDVQHALAASGPLLGVPAAELMNIWDGWRYNQKHEAGALSELYNMAVGPPKEK